MRIIVPLVKKWLCRLTSKDVKIQMMPLINRMCQEIQQLKQQQQLAHSVRWMIVLDDAMWIIIAQTEEKNDRIQVITICDWVKLEIELCIK